jgi:diacylglycerol kinase family enzyme
MQLMHANDLKFEIVRIKQKGHSSKLAQNAASKGLNVVIGAGGDGTCNEVINGIMLAKKHQKRELALGVLPIGRGIDFVFSIGGPFSLTDQMN